MDKIQAYKAIFKTFNDEVEAGEWLSAGQVAKIWSVTRWAVVDRIRRGTLPALRVGGRVYVHREDAYYAEL